MSSREHGGAVLAIALALAASQSGAVASGPEAIDEYRSWKAITPHQEGVPFDLSVRCVPATKAEFKEASKRHGPHTDRWIMVYANPLAAAALQDKEAKVFPVGSMIAKEKRGPLWGKPAEAEEVAFMIKRPKGQFVESGGWEFSFKPRPRRGATYDHCISCHRTGGSKDYVFGRYGLDGIRK